MAPAKVHEVPMGPRESREKLETALQENQAKYDAGVPFFTKKLFREVVAQFDALRDDRTISLRGLDGVNVEFRLRTGEEYSPHHYGDDKVCVITKPVLGYHSTRHLLPGYFFSPSLSCIHLPVNITHSTEVRDAHTNEIVSLWPASDYTTVRRELEQAKESLDSSEYFTELKAALATTTLPPKIDKIIALACGHMDRADVVHVANQRSVAQHALALSLRDFWAVSSATDAEGQATHEIACYAQDPIYTAVDQQVLSDLGVTILDDPRAFIEVDNASVVICISPDIPVKEIIADIARPAILIIDKVVTREPSIPQTDPVTKRVERMIDDYVELLFPGYDESLRGCSTYVRKADIVDRKWDWL